MQVTTLGLDLAKNVGQVHGVDAKGPVVLRQRLARTQVLPFLAQLPPCLIGLAASGGAHHWARELSTLGHTVKLMSPPFVRLYVKNQKNDANDAEGIGAAVRRPPMRFVPMQAVAPQDMPALHRIRERQIKARTALVHPMRGLWAEYGSGIAQGVSNVRHALPALLEDAANALPWSGRAWLSALAAAWRRLEHHSTETEQKMQRVLAQDEACQRLAPIEGIGPLTATAFVAAVGPAKTCTNGRQMAAWLGLVPRQHSSGGKPT